MFRLNKLKSEKSRHKIDFNFSNFQVFQSHPEARGYQNKVIENWDDIVILCRKDRATGEGAENCDDGAEAMVGEGENEVNFIPSSFGLEAVNEGVNTSRSQPPTHPSASITYVHDSHQKKRAKKDTIAEAITEMAISLKEYLASKRKQDRPQPIGEEIHEMVSKVSELAQLEVFRAM